MTAGIQNVFILIPACPESKENTRNNYTNQYMKKYQLKSTSSFKPSIDYGDHLNAEQLAAVTSKDGAALVIAGAGSGKTRVVTYRVAYLIDKGIDPSRIMLLTFTNKASREMLHRVEHLIKGESRRVWGGTFHHIGNMILRRYGSAIDLNSNFTILKIQRR